MFSSIESLCPPITGETEEGIANYMNENIGNFCILIKHFQCKNKFEHLPNILRDVLLERKHPMQAVLKSLLQSPKFADKKYLCFV